MLEYFTGGLLWGAAVAGFLAAIAALAFAVLLAAGLVELLETAVTHLRRASRKRIEELALLRAEKELRFVSASIRDRKGLFDGVTRESLSVTYELLGKRHTQEMKIVVPTGSESRRFVP